jgi:hypothetical protein
MTEAAQFSIHRSPSSNSARPFVIVLQSDDFHRMPTRVVAPLVAPPAMARLDGDHPRIAPVLLVQGRPYTLNPLDLATIGVNRLGEAVASFAGDDEAKRRIQDALDTVLKRSDRRPASCYTEKYFARGFSTTIALVDCSGCNWNSSEIEIPIRSAPSSPRIGT